MWRRSEKLQLIIDGIKLMNMKNLKASMLAVTATAFLFAGCQNEGISYLPDEARFSATIDGASRAYNQT